MNAFLFFRLLASFRKGGLGLAVCIGSVAAWGEPVENRTIQELPKKVVLEQALKDLDSVENVLRSKPEEPSALWMKIRILHALSVQDEARIHEGQATITRYVKASNSPESDWIAEAYRGAFQVVIAKHAFWPKGKMEALKQGLPALDSAVSKSPKQMEIRYLRLVSCYYLPFFLGRKWSVKEDFIALAKGLPGFQGQIPDRWYLGICEFVLKHAEMDKQTEATLARVYWSVKDRLNATEVTRENQRPAAGDEG